MDRCLLPKARAVGDQTIVTSVVDNPLLAPQLLLKLRNNALHFHNVEQHCHPWPEVPDEG
jgi:hypothetical protein